MERKGWPLLIQSDTNPSLTMAGQSWTRAYMLMCVHAPTLTPPNEPLTCEGCACESYPRDCYPCNTCNRNDETLSDQYRPPEGEEDT